MPPVNTDGTNYYSHITGSPMDDDEGGCHLSAHGGPFLITPTSGQPS